ncbi:MAG: DNA repair protein RecO C-terminal domain-containing protein [Nitratireductor sp.]
MGSVSSLPLLDELGFGLDLTRCAATGTQDNLVYVSPRTGKAVSADAGGNWHLKLLALVVISGAHLR